MMTANDDNQTQPAATSNKKPQCTTTNENRQHQQIWCRFTCLAGSHIDKIKRAKRLQVLQFFSVYNISTIGFFYTSLTPASGETLRLSRHGSRTRRLHSSFCSYLIYSISWFKIFTVLTFHKSPFSYVKPSFNTVTENISASDIVGGVSCYSARNESKIYYLKKKI